jgi:hypothetical protein
MKPRLLAVLLAALLGLPANARNIEIEGVNFASQLELDTSVMRLRGTGVLRYRVFIKAYAAALYLEESFLGQATQKSVLADVPRRLEIEYFWAIPADGFAKAMVDEISRSSDPETLERLRDRLEQMSAMYEDVEPGDRYAITYTPGRGTELAKNGRSLGIIGGADFSAALFGIWLGHDPIDDSLRNQLLAQHSS